MKFIHNEAELSHLLNGIPTPGHDYKPVVLWGTFRKEWEKSLSEGEYRVGGECTIHLGLTSSDCFIRFTEVREKDGSVICWKDYDVVAIHCQRAYADGIEMLNGESRRE